MAASADTKKVTALSVARLLASENASDNCAGLGYILSGAYPVADFQSEITALAGSEKRAPLYMTVGDVAAIVLHVFGITPYAGDNERVLAYIDQLGTR